MNIPNQISINLPAPPFVANDLFKPRCLHACIQMMMQACQAPHVFSFDEINTILRLRDNYWAAPYALFSALQVQGFETTHITSFSFQRFLTERENYLREVLGDEAGKVQAANTDIPTVVQDIQRMVKSSSVKLCEQVPTPNDIFNHLAHGWYVMPLVNSKALCGNDGHAGHFVVIYGCSADTVTLHDPGMNPHPALTVSWDRFENSWMPKQPAARSLTAFRRIPATPPKASSQPHHT